jgi:hypothetical protein
VEARANTNACSTVSIHMQAMQSSPIPCSKINGTIDVSPCCWRELMVTLEFVMNSQPMYSPVTSLKFVANFPLAVISHTPIHSHIFACAAFPSSR